uniref:PID domain-containing protein n=1 Tax=Strigamia maritima TaxID=126957 RepID=T1JKY9_STRMM
MIAVEFASYIGSVPVAGSEQPNRADYFRAQLEQMREAKKRKPVLLVISLAGIKACSTDGKNVFMAHALRRVSYATCDPENCQFSFLAREPKGHFSLQYCHSFLTQSSEQVREFSESLNF